MAAAAQKRARGDVIARRPNDECVPLSFAQRQMWVIDQISANNPAYNLPSGYRLHGPLDVAALERAFNAIVKRHEGLRTTFVIERGEPMQCVHPELTIKVTVTSLTHLPAGERDLRAQALASEEAQRPFDLSRLPLIRVLVFVLGENEHVLIVNVHHIVADGLSMGLLLRELDACYRAEATGGPEALPELRLQYPDFALWQRRTLASGEGYARELEFWRARLEGAQPIELPVDRPRPAVQSFAGSNVFFTIPPALTEELKALGAREGCTAFMVLLAAFQALLVRYSGAEDLVIGTPVSARTSAELEPLIGNFLNMVALRSDLSGDPTFVEVLQRSRETSIEAFSNAAAPFEAIMQHLQLERDPSRNPVFQVMLQVLSAATPRVGDFEVESFHFDLKFAQFDLSLHLYEEAGGYAGRFEYCTELFAPATIERFASSFRQLLHAIAGDPAKRLSELTVISPVERERLLHEWNATGAPCPGGVRVHELFRAQAMSTPERKALVAGDTSFSYAMLAERATGIARALRARGAGRGQHIGICLERGPDMVAALLGILETGAAYVPLDPSFPQDRLRFMAEDAQLALIVSTARLAGTIGMGREHQLLLDADAAAVESAPETPAGEAASAEDPAYVIYTSGSTGRPKGVVVPHRAVANFLTSMAREPGLGPDDVVVAVTTLSFDIAVLELLLPLTVGATVVLATAEVATDGRALRALIEQQGATLMQATPVTWRLLIDAGWTAQTPLKALVGGEALPRDLADQLIERGADLWNMYGPTETTVWSTCARVTETANGISIGKPIANTIVRILDARNGLCPIGVPGELCIGGRGLALGYWNRSELTAERFTADPHAPAATPLLYRTGDRARWRNDGTLEHLGRLDNQVKVRGFRIELGEIEAVLAEHPDVRQAAVHLWTVKPGDLRIVACCVPVRGTLSPISLRKHLRTRLPEYMIPQYFVTMEEIPLTPNGKIDRRRLATPVVTESRVGSREAPVGPVEAAIGEIWTRLLNPPRPVGRSDRFFEIGGYSLLGLRALRDIEDTLGARLDFHVLFRETLADIAVRCGAGRAAALQGPGALGLAGSAA